eukprot:TRINITY_DN5068_c0_g1_i1.p1 TRINITY_DN5068_c0_g1~~TRINITY_DN5068_c0_g1_i1.p1  ORF type:complete len:678 (+),score=216.37 TRINITY_DN5068_c0_g1_i1:48-2081(+)
MSGGEYSSGASMNAGQPNYGWQPAPQHQQQQQQQWQPQPTWQPPPPPQQGSDYHRGYSQAVRDGAGGGGGGAQVASTLANFAIFVGIPVYFLYRMNKGASGPGGSKMMNQMLEQINPIQKRNFRVLVKDTKFKDVIGIPEAKEEVQEYVDFLKSPKQYTELGARLPRGALLTGKPGTGKTLLAKAVAGEADVSFFSAGGSDFIEIFGGSGPKRVRELFQEAKNSAPAVIFIDELDAVGSKRSAGGDQGIGGEENRTTNALLAEMDGMGTNDNVVVFAATNHPEALDTALTRAGRFDRKINIPVPDKQAREELFEFYLQKIITAKNYDEKSKKVLEARKKYEEELEKKKEKMAEDKKKLEKLKGQLTEIEKKEESKENTKKIELLTKEISDLEKNTFEEVPSKACTTPPTDEEIDEAHDLYRTLAEATPGVTPATISTVCNEAAIVAARNGSSFVKPQHIRDAIDNVLIGKKHRQRMSPAALKRVAYHEAGHTVAAWLLTSQTPVIKVSIVPRGSAGGYTQFSQREELDPRPQESLIDEIRVKLGGRCAELLFFKDLTTGAHDDLKRAYQDAQSLVQFYGMSDLGNFSIEPQSEQRGRAFSSVSESLKHDIENKAREIVDSAFNDTMKLLSDNKEKLKAVSEALLEKKELSEKDLTKLIGARKPHPETEIVVGKASAA